ncbi:MAG: hypothetical protein IBX68_03130 [Dehalococcoidia bacterium]|nr:hypothetical protein [Dehalococcoidia bacterium]
MARTNGQVKIFQAQISPPSQYGLEKGQVLTSINDLTAENHDLSNRLKHVDALKKLAELAVIEADRQAARIRTEAEEAARTRAHSIVAEAEERARGILAQAERSALQMLVEAQEKATGTNGASAEKDGNRAQTLQADNAAAHLQTPVECRPTVRDSVTNRSLAELVIPGPVPLHQIFRLHKHLSKTCGVKVLDLKGSAGKGIRVRMDVPATMPVVDVLECLPGFEVSGEIQDLVEPSADEEQDLHVRKFFVSVR